MIGVNNFNTSTITMIDRKPVPYDGAVLEFDNDQEYHNYPTFTFDPAILPIGKSYNFCETNHVLEFYRDNIAPGEDSIYVIAVTNNTTGHFNTQTRKAYSKLLQENKNPLFGKWKKETTLEEVLLQPGTITICFLDTTYAETDITETEALQLKQRYNQDYILKINPNGEWRSI